MGTLQYDSETVSGIVCSLGVNIECLSGDTLFETRDKVPSKADLLKRGRDMFGVCHYKIY